MAQVISWVAEGRLVAAFQGCFVGTSEDSLVGTVAVEDTVVVVDTFVGCRRRVEDTAAGCQRDMEDVAGGFACKFEGPPQPPWQPTD